MKKYRRSRSRSKWDSKLESKFYSYWKNEYPHLLPVTQYHFHPQRAWRFDFAWPDHRVAMEIQGFGTGHTSYDGMASDYEKHNSATTLSWRMFYFMSCHLEDDTISATCRYLYGVLTGGRSPAGNPHESRGFADHINKARRRLLEGPDFP